MSSWLQVFLALLLAHVMGDFPLQTRGMVLGKQAFRASAYLSHGLVHLLASLAAVVVFTDLSLATGAALLALALLVAAHLAFDLGKALVVRRWPAGDGALLYSADQCAHALLVAAVAILATGTLPPVATLHAQWIAWHHSVLVFVLVVSASVFPAGYLIRYLLRPLSDQLGAANERQGANRESLEGLGNAGLYLGWLERGLLVVAFAIGSFTAVGLIIGAKSIARFPEFRSRAFAEYFLIGTLLSVAIAAAGGFVLRQSLAAL